MRRALFGDIRHGVGEGALRDTSRDPECPEANIDPFCYQERSHECARTPVKVSLEDLAEPVA